MAKKRAAKADGPPPATRRRWRGPLAKGLLVLAVVGLGGVAIAWLGERAADGIKHRPRFAVRFEDVECALPPGQDRAVFFAEVRYLGDPPATFQSADANDRDRVAAAFARHPWVAHVGEAGIEPGRYVLPLTFRVPVLAVTVLNATPAVRLVDAAGILLPVCEVPEQLPRLTTAVAAPKTPAGRPWDDILVQRAIELAKDFAPATLEKTTAGWRLTQADGKVLAVTR